ncbi:hypothetical protein KUTeg_006783 [Tegillarca granosa]|uniref:Carboxylesterase type B domain-containing protein n=1 Tax=Tegillarca granosa TaxID=220873 RepID=A0ABQ9FBB7_TEGGR|nr:hypothetical protein KUTeg_006783 [Tegillarca granosa]
MGTLVILSLHYICFFVFHLVSAKEEYTVTTKVGDIIGHTSKASFNGSSAGVLKFLGIPYALPPVGDLRFSKPRRYPDFQSPFNASNLGPGCPQNAFLSSTWIPGPTIFDEDCLFLNIFVPFKDDEAMHTNISSSSYPVMIWIHGGAYLIGQSSMYSGDGASSVIFHAMYPGNKGLIKRVISQSGSPMSAWAYVKKDKSIELAKRFATKMNCSIFTSQEMIACLRNRTSEDIVKFSKVGTEIETIFRSEWVSFADGEFIEQFPPDSFRNPFSMSKNRTEIFSGIDIMIGVSSGDGGFIAQFCYIPFIKDVVKATNESGSDVFQRAFMPVVINDQYNLNLMCYETHHPYDGFKHFHMAQDISTDINFAMPATFTVIDHDLLNHGRKNTYLFKFSHLSSFNHDRPQWLFGANHGDELPYVFGFPVEMVKGFGYINNTTPEEIELSSAIMTYWTNFAKTGYASEVLIKLKNINDPNKPIGYSSLHHWPAYNRYTEAYIDLNIPLKVRNRMFMSRETLWTDLAPKLIKDVSKGWLSNPTYPCKLSYHGWLHLQPDVADDIILCLAIFCSVLLLLLVGTCKVKFQNYRETISLEESYVHNNANSETQNLLLAIVYINARGGVPVRLFQTPVDVGARTLKMVYKIHLKKIQIIRYYAFKPHHRRIKGSLLSEYTTQQTLPNSQQTPCQDSHGVDCDYLAFTSVCTNNAKLAKDCVPKHFLFRIR